MSDLTQGLTALANSREAYETADSYYRGTVGEYFSSARIARLLSNGKRFNLNYAKVPVESRLSRIEIASVSVPGDDATTAILQQAVWNNNDLILRQKQLHEAALSLGDAYLIVWPGDEDGTVMMDYNSPIGCRVIYRVDNPLIPAYAIKVWALGDDVFRANLYYADRIEKYISMQGMKKDDQWVEYVEEDGDLWPILNPFGQVPVFHFSSNGYPYGTPVHKAGYSAQDAITKLNNLQMSTAEYSSFPQRYALTDRAVAECGTDAFGDDFGDTVGTPTTPNPDAAASVRTGPTEMQVFNNVRAVGEFGTATPDSLIASLNFQIKAMAQTTATPLHFFDPSGDAPSGESLRRAEAPLVKSVNDLKLGLTRPWSKALSFALLVLGYNKAVDVRWTPSQSIDDEDGWKVTSAKIAAGVPPYQALLEAGYTEAQLADWNVSTESSVAPVTGPVDPTATQ